MSTHYEQSLVDRADLFLRALASDHESRVILERYGLGATEKERGRALLLDASKALVWTDDGRAWDFLEPTPERRLREARGWYADRRRRHYRACFRRVEGALLRRTRFVERLVEATRALVDAASPLARTRDRSALRRDLERASQERPPEAPPPKDTVLVELSGWYERWRLLAQRTLRQRPDLLAHYGLVAGLPPPRLRGREAELVYGEKAAPRLAAS